MVLITIVIGAFVNQLITRGAHIVLGRNSLITPLVFVEFLSLLNPLDFIGLSRVNIGPFLRFAG